MVSVIQCDSWDTSGFVEEVLHRVRAGSAQVTVTGAGYFVSSASLVVATLCRDHAGQVCVASWSTAPQGDRPALSVSVTPAAAALAPASAPTHAAPAAPWPAVYSPSSSMRNAPPRPAAVSSPREGQQVFCSPPRSTVLRTR
eukprot:TRINITY_DN66183_c0_g1_i1.p1 TRINITY_DN66183_c0_g1~~TRINITY_DN66183_c0_g1_i1.p1  ORF type:complete len:142 (+),score=13.30 TRINITY_DN66183_c0_g1_i1:75-500(+)